MGRSAAVFDLDRTLIRGASAPVISEALGQVGLAPGRSVPGQGLLFRAYDLFGETRPAMFFTRQLARASTGWSSERLRDAGALAAGKLEAMVQPFAHAAIEEHRAAGRMLVLATTTPEQLVRPLAELLGIPHVLATRYQEVGGRLTGRIDGEFIWSRKKCEAFRSWAGEHGVIAEESYAYSDSWFDRPLLGAVGHPVAVNPDPRLAALAVARRWPVVWFDVPPGVPKIAGVVEPQRMLMSLARSELLPWVRFDLEGLDRIPDSGPVILVANHRSYFDPLAVGFTLARKGRPARFLGKKEVFDVPVVGNLVGALGGIRVDRGTGSGEPLERAAEALRAGELVAIMPQGTIPRGRAFFDPVLRGRWGAARLSMMTGAPVVPLGIWGTEKVWPRSERIPNVLAVTDPPTVRIRVGDAVALGGLDLEEDTARIMDSIAALLPPIASVEREPSEQELARTLPPGYQGDPDHEADRRPGED